MKPEKVTHVACGRAHTLICTGKISLFYNYFINLVNYVFSNNKIFIDRIFQSKKFLFVVHYDIINSFIVRTYL